MLSNSAQYADFIGVSHLDRNRFPSSLSFCSTFLTAALQYVSDNMDQQAVPFAVVIFDNPAPKKVSGSSILSSLNSLHSLHCVVRHVINVTEYQLIVLESVWIDCWSKPNIGICFCRPVIEIVESLGKQRSIRGSTTLQPI